MSCEKHIYLIVLCSSQYQCVIELKLILQYSATELGGHGGGGEYNIQIGFGWTNGVIMDFLAKYGQQLTSTGPLLKS